MRKLMWLCCIVAFFTVKAFGSKGVMVPHLFVGPLGSLKATSEVTITNLAPEPCHAIMTLRVKQGNVRDVMVEGLGDVFFEPLEDSSLDPTHPDAPPDFASLMVIVVRTAIAPNGGANRIVFSAPEAVELVVGALRISPHSDSSCYREDPAEDSPFYRPLSSSTKYTVWRTPKGRNEWEVFEEFSVPENPRTTDSLLFHNDCIHLSASFTEGQTLAMAFSPGFPLVVPHHEVQGMYLDIEQYDPQGNFVQSWPRWYLYRGDTHRVPSNVQGESVVNLRARLKSDDFTTPTAPLIIGVRVSNSRKSYQYSGMPYYPCPPSSGTTRSEQSAQIRHRFNAEQNLMRMRQLEERVLEQLD